MSFSLIDFPAKRQEIKKRHKTEIENSQSRPHQIIVYEKKHAEELKVDFSSEKHSNKDGFPLIPFLFIRFSRFLV